MGVGSLLCSFRHASSFVLRDDRAGSGSLRRFILLL